MEAGEVVDARFVIQRRVASGGMGHIYRALDRHSGEIVAFKLLHGHASERPVRFKREIEVLLSLDHPTIVRYVANGTTSRGAPYLVMEWLEGTTLGERLAHGHLGVEDSLAVGAGIAEALAVVHAAGFIHRDLKPSNIFLVGGSVSRIKLIDFGLARVAHADGGRTELTVPGLVLGTIGYLAPEQARGEPTVDARADVFALGCVIYRCVTGRRPFVGEDDLSVLLKIIVEEPQRLREVRADVPQALDELVARMLAKAPGLRPPHGGAVVDAIEALGAGAPITVRTRQPELTASERRVMGLVLTRDPAEGPHRPSAAAPGAPGPPGGELVSLLHGTVERHRGQLELLADGSSLAVFTSDGEATDLAVRAARCALSIRALCPTAPVVVVSGRAELEGRYLVGQLIDRAVGLLPQAASPAHAPPHSIRLDDVTAALLGPGFVVGGGFLEGERESLEAPRTLLGKPTTFVGRDREILLLSAAYERSIEEPGANVVLVTAAAGMGKSRLVAEFLRRLRQRDDAPGIWIGRGDPMSAGSSFGLLGQALRRAFGVLEGDSLEARRGKIQERVTRGEPRPAEAARVAAFLGELVGTAFPDDIQLRAARRDPQVLGDQMRRAWEDFLRAECTVRPLVLVLEDLHWGDVPTVKLVDAALRHLETRPLLVVAIGRPEVHQLFPDIWAGRGVEEVHLARLPRGSGERLVRSVLGSAVSAALVGGLVERADGNAFYLEELIRAVAEGKGAELPETVLAMVQARLEALHVEERRVLRAASVFGQRFPEGGVSTLLGGARVRGWLRTLADQELIVAAEEGRSSGDATYRFRHALVREAAYGMLTAPDRKLGHQLAGEWLEAAGETDATVLAEHFQLGVEYPRAAAWYHRAAEHAFEGNDLETALDRAGRGLACVEDPESVLAGELMLVRTKASRWLGRNQEAEDAAISAMRLFPLGGARWCEAAAEVVHLSAKLGNTEHLLSCTDALLALGPATDREAAASFAIALARAATNLQLSAARPALVEVLLERAGEAAAQAAGDPAVAGHVEWARSLRALAGGDLSTFLERVQASRASLELAGDLRSECIQALNAAHGFLQLGAYPEAEEILREALLRAKRLALGNVRTFAKLNLGLALLGQGRLEEALSMEENVLTLFREQADRPLETGTRVYLAMILAAQGDREGAARQALAVVEDPQAKPSSRAYARAILADVRLAEGRPAEALAAAEEALSLLTTLDGIEEGEALIRVVYAEALAAVGDRGGARAAAEDARDHLLARAAKVIDPELRQSFLHHVPENARTLALASTWE